MSLRRPIAALIFGAALASSHWIAYTRGGNDRTRVILRDIHPDYLDPCRAIGRSPEPMT